MSEKVSDIAEIDSVVTGSERHMMPKLLEAEGVRIKVSERDRGVVVTVRAVKGEPNSPLQEIRWAMNAHEQATARVEHVEVTL